MIRLLLLAAACASLPGLFPFPHLTPDMLRNPDSAMRLVRIEDMIAAGHRLHLVVRDGSGSGTIVQWSHLLDSLLLLLATPLAPSLGWHAALHAAGLVSGPLSLAALGAATAWAAAPVARPGWLWLGAYAAGAAPAIRNYGAVGEISHHVLLAVSAVMAAGWTLRLLRHETPPAIGAVSLAAWTVFGLWLSPEAIPFCLAGAGSLWLAWLLHPTPGLQRALTAHGLTFVALTTLDVAVDPPPAGRGALDPDCVSLLFVLLAAGAAAAAMAARTGRRWPTIAVAAMAAVGFFVAAPQILQGTQGLMTPEQNAAMLPYVSEFTPAASLADWITFLSGAIFAFSALLAWAWKMRRTQTGKLLAYTAACILASVALAAHNLRFAGYPEVASAILLPVLLSSISAASLAASAQSAARLVTILAIVGLPAAYNLLAEPTHMAATSPPIACGIAGAAALLTPYPGQIVLADVNDTPDLLYRTRSLTVGSLYHRSPANFMRLRAAWRSEPGSTPSPEFQATKATLVLACPGAARSSLLAGLPLTTLLDRLDADAPPSWLELKGSENGYKLYEEKQSFIEKTDQKAFTP